MVDYWHCRLQSRVTSVFNVDALVSPCCEVSHFHLNRFVSDLSDLTYSGMEAENYVKTIMTSIVIPTTISLRPSVWMDSFEESTSHTNQIGRPKSHKPHLIWDIRCLLTSDCCVKRPLLTTEAERWRETVMMEAVMEFQWGYLPEVDGRESHWESKSCDCSVLPCRHHSWWGSDLSRHDWSVFDCT